MSWTPFSIFALYTVSTTGRCTDQVRDLGSVAATLSAGTPARSHDPRFAVTTQFGSRHRTTWVGQLVHTLFGSLKV